MNWISVEERLPEDEAVVILSTATGVVTMGWRYTHPDRGVRWFDITHGRWVESAVTHWVELPAPPQ